VIYPLLASAATAIALVAMLVAVERRLPPRSYPSPDPEPEDDEGFCEVCGGPCRGH